MAWVHIDQVNMSIHTKLQNKDHVNEALVFLLQTAPNPPSLLSFADVANTSLAITWKGPPDWTDHNDFEVQWLPKEALTILNPYSNKKSEGRIVYGLRPGRSYQFSVKTVSGDSWKTYSKPVSGSVRTSMPCFTTLGF